MIEHDIIFDVVLIDINNLKTFSYTAVKSTTPCLLHMITQNPTPKNQMNIPNYNQ